MQAFRLDRGIRVVPVALLALAVMVVWCVPMWAGPAPQGPSGGGGRKKGPPKHDEEQTTVDDRPVGGETGWIAGFKSSEEDEDAGEDFMGILKFKPMGKRVRSFELRVPRDPLPVVELGERSDLDLEEYPDLLAKGLYCTASWKSEEADSGDTKKKKKSRMPRDLTQIRFETMDIEGEIAEIKDDVITIKARPKGDQPWPDQLGSAGSKPDRGAGTGKPGRTPLKKLKLRVFEDVTRFTDAENEEIDLGNFEKKQSVEATVVYGKKGGIVVHLRTPSLKSEDQGEARGEGGGRGSRPQG